MLLFFSIVILLISSVLCVLSYIKNTETKVFENDFIHEIASIFYNTECKSVEEIKNKIMKYKKLDSINKDLLNEIDAMRDEIRKYQEIILKSIGEKNQYLSEIQQLKNNEKNFTVQIEKLKIQVKENKYETEEIKFDETIIDKIMEHARKVYYPLSGLSKQFIEDQNSLNHYFMMGKELHGNSKNQYIGLKYERFVAAFYHAQGYDIYFNGAEKCKKDHGIDLIARKGNKTLLIQCKCYASDTPLNEDTLLKMAGAIKLFQYDNGIHWKSYKGVFCIHKDKVSNIFISYAKKLGIELNISFKMHEPFPVIKYYKNRYYLPIDEPYDHVMLTQNVKLFTSMSELHEYLKEYLPLEFNDNTGCIKFSIESQDIGNGISEKR